MEKSKKKTDDTMTVIKKRLKVIKIPCKKIHQNKTRKQKSIAKQNPCIRLKTDLNSL